MILSKHLVEIKSECFFDPTSTFFGATVVDHLLAGATWLDGACSEKTEYRKIRHKHLLIFAGSYLLAPYN